MEERLYASSPVERLDGVVDKPLASSVLVRRDGVVDEL